MATAVNHGPTGVVNTANSPGMPADPCEVLKAKYGINSDTHASNKKANAGTDSGKQSHHILQGACTNNLIDYDQAMATLIQNSHLDTTHQITTRRQNNRRDNKANGTAGPKPAKTLGELKKLSKDDLVDSFVNGEKMPPEDAEKLADCLVADAEKKIKKEAEEREEEVDDSTPVLQTGGCLPVGTLVWLDDTTRVEVQHLRQGLLVQGRRRRLPIVRFDPCINSLVRLQVEGGWVAMAPFHRVLAAEGGFVRADALRPGRRVQTQGGPRPVDAVEWDHAPRPVLAFGVGQGLECRIGAMGLWIELPDTGVRVVEVVDLSDIPLEEKQDARAASVASPASVELHA